MTPKQAEAVDTLLDLFRQSRNSPEAARGFVGMALVMAKKDILDYLIAGLLKQAQSLNILPTKSLLFRDMAFEIERKQNERTI